MSDEGNSVLASMCADGGTPWGSRGKTVDKGSWKRHDREKHQNELPSNNDTFENDPDAATVHHPSIMNDDLK